MARSKKTNQLSYIEETPKHHPRLVNVIAKGVRTRIQSSKDAGLYITYSRGSEIVREYPNGEIRIIGHIDNAPLLVEEDARATLS